MSTLEPISVRADAPAVLELPPAHLELTWRPLQETDADALFALVQAVEEADAPAQRESHDEVVELFEGAWKDLHRDSLGGFDASGALRAYGLVEVRPGDARTVRAFLRGGVHPQWRGRGLGRAVSAWLEGRGRQKLVETGKELPARLAVFVDEAARDQRRLWAAAGFSPVRWYTGMRRDLAAPLPDAPVPDGVRIVPWSAELDDAVRRAHNEAFADHWGSEPQTPETWRHDAHFRPAWSFVALAEGGQPGDDHAPDAPVVAGYLLSGAYEQDWEPLGYTCGSTELLGVRRPWRGTGLGSALLRHAMEAYRADDMQYATLGVDTANPTGAHGLYVRLGYEPTQGQVLYSVEL
ncbi:GNAT family N-acetyltransferase [Actinotalea solisilvae]|uniref:GNAT family N-acetyltransferase n=1 Tax=Actinotalea solisilvae TaxID=2072922 RepID=UPI0027DE7AB9|nr:GNAT family N-acetyltransferase [Actinotalea solisilvae]